MTALVLVCSIGTGIGLAGVVAALRGWPEPRDASGPVTRDLGVVLRRRQRPSGSTNRATQGWVGKLGVPLVSAVVVGTVTRWPVAALLAAVAAIALPRVLRSTASHASTRRTEAMAVWTELLRDSLTASAGLAGAIVATARVAPEEIKVPVVHLADRIMSGVPMDDALRLFAVAIDDASAEEVICALRLAAASRAQRLVDLLGALADSTRDEVAMRLRVEASRASARSSVRTVIGFSVAFVALLVVVAHSYLAPYGSVTGQLVLVVVGLCDAAGLMLMVRLVRPPSWRRPSREEMAT
jgi:tight adherence protein B